MISETDFEEFYTRNYKSVYRICYVYLKDKAEAEDAAADVFLKALTGSAEFDGGERERGWLAVAAMNLCKDRLKHWWWKKRAAVENVDDFSSKDGGRDETLEKVLLLPVKYKDVVYLFYYLGYKTDEIAAMLGEKPSTVRNRLRDARIILKKELEADDEE